MYRTSNGDRTLHGPEARLFCDAFGVTVDHVHEFEIDGFCFNIPIFDSLTLNSKLAMLEQVGSALLIDETPPPQLSAVVEATVGTVFSVLEELLYLEIEPTPEGLTVKTLVREMMLATMSQETDPKDLPDVHCADTSEWDVVLECITGRVLWDEDWMDDDLYLDDSVATEQVKAFMGIDPLYYSAIAPDPTDEMMPEIIERLQKLTRHSE